MEVASEISNAMLEARNTEMRKLEASLEAERKTVLELNGHLGSVQMQLQLLTQDHDRRAALESSNATVLSRDNALLREDLKRSLEARESLQEKLDLVQKELATLMGAKFKLETERSRMKADEQAAEGVHAARLLSEKQQAEEQRRRLESQLQQAEETLSKLKIENAGLHSNVRLLQDKLQNGFFDKPLQEVKETTAVPRSLSSATGREDFGADFESSIIQRGNGKPSANGIVADREADFLHFKKETVRAQCKANMLELLADIEQ